MNTDTMKSIDDLLAKRNAGNDAAGYQAFVLMQKAWPMLKAENDRLRAALNFIGGFEAYDVDQAYIEVRNHARNALKLADQQKEEQGK